VIAEIGSGVWGPQATAPTDRHWLIWAEVRIPGATLLGRGFPEPWTCAC
jgi:hypothetical protein